MPSIADDLHALNFQLIASALSQLECSWSIGVGGVVEHSACVVRQPTHCESAVVI